MRSETMSVYAKEPTHFLKTNEKYLHNYPSRHVFGEYLKKCFKNAKELAQKAKFELVIIKDEAIDVSDNVNSKKTIFTKNCNLEVDFVFIAIGNIPSNNFKIFKQNPNYFKNPYEKNVYKKIPLHEDVIIIGSSLTSVDTILALRSSGHHGDIFVISRNGLIPKVQNSIPDYKNIKLKFLNMKVLKMETENFKNKMPIKRVFQLFQNELEPALGKFFNWKSILNEKACNFKTFSKNVDSAEKNNQSWQKILAATGHIISVLWNCIQRKDQISFIKKYYSFWCVYRHCMPVENAKKILTYLKDNKLRVFSGLEKITYDKTREKFKVTFNKKRTKNIKAKYLINATGTNYEIKNSDSKLLKNLMKRNLIKENPCGGIEVNFNTNEASKNIFVIGPLTRGTHFYTGAVIRNAFDAEKVTKLLIKRQIEAQKKKV